MKKFLTKTTALTAGIIFSVFGVMSEVSAGWWDSGTQEANVRADLKPTGELTISDMIQNVLVWVLGFLALIAVIIFIVAGFMIMTAGGDEDKVKKGKTWMINAVIGIIVIFLSWSLVKWLFGFIGSGGQAVVGG